MGLRSFQSLELTIPAATLPLTLEEVKDHLVVEGADRDDLISQMINSATSYVDALGVLGRAMVTQTWGQWVGNSPGKVSLLMGPVQNLSSVKYFDTDGVWTTASFSDFELQKAGEWAVLKPVSGASWPTARAGPAAICISYTAGYGSADDVPASIKQAMLMLISHWFENRESVIVGTTSSVTPFGFDALISGHRSGWYG